jgi:hypothetical protein
MQPSSATLFGAPSPFLPKSKTWIFDSCVRVYKMFLSSSMVISMTASTAPNLRAFGTTHL